MWAGYNFSAGKNLVLNITPMIGGVFGRTNGIAPGCEASLTYKKVALSISNEYVFDTGGRSGNFYYSWPQLTYSPLEWFRVGLVAQRTKAFHTPRRCAARVPGRGVPQTVGIHHVRLQCRFYRTDGSA